MESETQQQQPAITPSLAIALAVGICILFVLLMGVYPTPYLDAARTSVLSLF
jgi:hypothetical protein